MQKKTAPLGEKRQNRTIGMVFLVLGFTAVSGGLMLLFTWSLLGLLGLLLILGGSVLMSLSYLQMTGFYIAVCPQCKHTSLRKDDCLEEDTEARQKNISEKRKLDSLHLERKNPVFLIRDIG